MESTIRGLSVAANLESVHIERKRAREIYIYVQTSIYIYRHIHILFRVYNILRYWYWGPIWIPVAPTVVQVYDFRARLGSNMQAKGIANTILSSEVYLRSV